MPYLLRSQVPELCGFSRKQQRFLLKEALILLKGDDPWFAPAMSLLSCGVVAFAVTLSSLLFPFGYRPGWAAGALALVICGLGEALCIHVFLSHLRSFLRLAIEKHSSALEAIP